MFTIYEPLYKMKWNKLVRYSNKNMKNGEMKIAAAAAIDLCILEGPLYF